MIRRQETTVVCFHPVGLGLGIVGLFLVGAIAAATFAGGLN